MTRSGVPGDQESSLFSQLREFGDGLESSAPRLDIDAAVARLHQVGLDFGFLPPASVPQAGLGTTGSELEEECAPFDVEAGAAQLRRAAEDRGLLPQREPARPVGDPRAGQALGRPGDMATDPGARRIVVGVDGSAESVAALKWACREASLRPAEVHAVLALESAAHQLASYAVPSPVKPGVSWGAAREVLRRTVSEAVRLYPGLSIRTEIAEGLAARVLLDHVTGADMLVLGRNAHGPDPYRGAGPVIRACLRAAPCPVVVIGPVAQVAPEAAAPAASGTAFDPAEWEAYLIPVGHRG
jgi:nucleotide-binding universal stress UspA family protein